MKLPRNNPVVGLTPRSPWLMNSQTAGLLVIDVQQKLVPLIPGHEVLTWNIQRLLSGAATLDVRSAATEQYPSGLGATISEVADHWNRDSETWFGVSEKTMFSCRECANIFDQLSAQGVHQLLLCGIETHVCVAQTALDLLAAGFQVQICVDAVGARFAIDHQTALRRLESAGCLLTTTEAALFEWCQQAGDAKFKAISQLVRQPHPSAG